MKWIQLSIIVASSITACTTQQAVKDVTIAVSAAECLLTSYEAAMAMGQTQSQAIDTAAQQCGVIPPVANEFLAAYISASEKRVKR